MEAWTKNRHLRSFRSLTLFRNGRSYFVHSTLFAGRRKRVPKSFLLRSCRSLNATFKGKYTPYFMYHLLPIMEKSYQLGILFPPYSGEVNLNKGVSFHSKGVESGWVGRHSFIILLSYPFYKLQRINRAHPIHTPNRATGDLLGLLAQEKISANPQDRPPFSRGRKGRPPPPLAHGSFLAVSGTGLSQSEWVRSGQSFW